MTRAEFEKVVVEALKLLPKRFRDKLDNVDIVIEDGPSEDETLLGLYEGTPQSERLSDSYNLALPDKITLFQKNIEAECFETGADIRREVADTILHEVAHHFGIDDDRLDELDVY